MIKSDSYLFLIFCSLLQITVVIMTLNGKLDFKEDDHSQQKVFTLAGYNAQPEVKAELVEKIRSLGGRVHEAAGWSDEVTHVIAANFGHFLEKVMAGLVSGAWIVTRRYVDASHQRGGWASTRAYISDDLVIRYRERRHRVTSGLWQGWRIVFAMDNNVQSRVYTRVVRAGGAEVINHTSLRDLINNSNDVDKLDYIVIDNDQHQDWGEWSTLVKKQREQGYWSNLRHIQYKFFFNCITKCEVVSVKEHLILENERILDSMKRSVDDADVEVKRFKPAPVIVDLESSDDDDLEVLEQRLAARNTIHRRRVYLEKNITGEVVDVGDRSEDETVNNKSHGINLGLQQAIRALQPRISVQNRTDSVLNDDGDTIDSDDEIEIVMSKPGESRKNCSVDRRSVMFQSRMKELRDDNDDHDDGESSSSVSQTDETSSVRDPSPEVTAPVEPVPIILPTQPFPDMDSDENIKLVDKILECVVERQIITQEHLSVSGVSMKQFKYDKHGECSTLTKIESVDSSVREEFYQKYLDNDNNMMNQVSNIMSSIKFLNQFTSLTCHATPAILNNLMVECIMNQESQIIVDQALNYLNLTLFRHISCVSSNMMSRSSWITMILSSCRADDNVNFDSFDLDNKQDTAMSAKFFSKLLKRVMNSGTEERGPLKLLKLLVDIFAKDIQMLWRMSRSVSSYPLLYHLLGDSVAGVMESVKRVIVPLYVSSLRCDGEVRSVVRRLVSLTALMMASLDSVNKQSYINCGHKLDMANCLAAALHTWTSDAHNDQLLRSEMLLLTPDWFVMLVSRSLLTLSSSGSVPRLTNVKDLTASLSKLTIDSPPVVSTCYETLFYKTLSTFHIHTCLRTLWSRVISDKTVSQVYTMMSRLDKIQERKSKKDPVVRFRSGVTCKVAPITEDIICLARFCYGENDTEISSLSAMLFKMTGPTNF